MYVIFNFNLPTNFIFKRKFDDSWFVLPIQYIGCDMIRYFIQCPGKTAQIEHK